MLFQLDAKDAVCAEDLDEMNIEIMRNTLYKAYLDDFAKYCNKMGGSTAAVMGDLLSFEVIAPTPLLQQALKTSASCLIPEFAVPLQNTALR